MQSRVSDRIRNWFSWLFDDYGFTTVNEQLFESFGNWVVILESDRCGRIRLMRDRGEIFLACGPRWSSASWDVGPWYSLDTVIRYLSRGKNRLDPVYGEMEEQLEHLAGVLQPNLDDICALFWGDVFWSKKHELDALQETLEDEIWDQLLARPSDDL